MNHVPREPACACDHPGAVKALISVEAALAWIARTVVPISDTERVTLTRGRGRALAAPVHARADLPPFANAAMDGYAVAWDSLTGPSPWTLPVADRIAAGETGRGACPKGAAIRIFTGAPLPNGTDTVIMQENVCVQGNEISVAARPTRGQHMRRAGEIASQGHLLLPAGRRLSDRDIALAAAAGCADIAVRRTPKVGLLITGDELRGPGHPCANGAIWDANGPMIETALARAGVDLVAREHSGDDRAATGRRLAELSERVDLIITTGGISVGDEDHVKPAMDALGVRDGFSGVALKPGKPVSFGKLGTACWLGLPGNPVSAFVTWHLFGRVLLSALQGIVARPLPAIPAQCETHLVHRAGRAEYRLARITGLAPGGGLSLSCPQGAETGHLTWLAQSDGLVCLPRESGDIPAGTDVMFRPFDWET